MKNLNTQFLSIHRGRKRFIKTSPMVDFVNWMSLLAELKNFLSNQSSFQIVGNNVYFEFTSLTLPPKMMLEVIGPPVSLEKDAWQLADQESSQAFVGAIVGLDVFNMDQGELLASVKALKEALLADYPSELSEIFQIVFNHNKIELHFFRQKDYIQK
jgi:hypothetical protein